MSESAVLFNGPVYVTVTEDGTFTYQKCEDAENHLALLSEEGKHPVPFKFGGVWVAIQPQPPIAAVCETPDLAFTALSTLIKQVTDFIGDTVGLHPTSEMMARRAAAVLSEASEEEFHVRHTREQREQRQAERA